MDILHGTMLYQFLVSDRQRRTLAGTPTGVGPERTGGERSERRAPPERPLARWLRRR